MIQVYAVFQSCIHPCQFPMLTSSAGFDKLQLQNITETLLLLVIIHIVTFNYTH